MILNAKRRVLQPSTASADSSSSNSAEAAQDMLEPWSEFLERTTRLVEDRLAAAGEEEWLVAWCRRKWRWAGKLARDDRHKWSFTALLWNPAIHSHRGGSRAQARPCKRWDDDFVVFLRESRIEEPWIEVAMDQERWDQLEGSFIEQLAC